MNEGSLPPIPSESGASGKTIPAAWESLLDAIEDGICVQSLESRILFANSAFASIVGAPLEQIVGRSSAEVFGYVNETGAIPQFCARVVCGEAGQSSDEEIASRRDGHRLRSRITPVLDEAGKAIAFMMVVRDITDTVASEREISRRQQASRFGELAASLAHEIKNPLAGIQGAVDILIERRSATDPERKLLEGVRGEVRRIDAIIQFMLNRAQPVPVNLQPASVTVAVQRAVTLARRQAAKLASALGRQVTVEFIADSSPVVMKIDSGQIEDAVHGLLTNAIEAIDANGSVVVRLSESGGAEGTDGEVIIEVEDSGRGISDEDKARIFSPFFSTNPGGAGLGLPSVRRIARAHGGRVEVFSVLGQGATFTIRLPRAPRQYA